MYLVNTAHHSCLTEVGPRWHTRIPRKWNGLLETYQEKVGLQDNCAMNNTCPETGPESPFCKETLLDGLGALGMPVVPWARGLTLWLPSAPGFITPHTRSPGSGDE